MDFINYTISRQQNSTLRKQNISRRRKFISTEQNILRQWINIFERTNIISREWNICSTERSILWQQILSYGWEWNISQERLLLSKTKYHFEITTYFVRLKYHFMSGSEIYSSLEQNRFNRVKYFVGTKCFMRREQDPTLWEQNINIISREWIFLIERNII